MTSAHLYFVSCIISFFFFSSRRRHTRWPRDWSSDVCSSDLVICVGQATKIVPYLTDMPKTYEVTCALGIATETEDAYGDIIAKTTIDEPPTLDAIKHGLRQFIGDIKQTPPMYSAMSVRDKRLYEYA